MHVGISYGDPTGGLHGAVAVLSALLHRAASGEGQYIDLSQQETSVAVLGEGVLEQTVSGTQPARDGNRNPRMAPHGVFRCAGEQRWVAIAVRSDEEFRRCAEVMDQPELAADPRFASLPARKANEDALEAALSAWTVTLRAEEVAERLQRAGLAASVSMHSQDLAEDGRERKRLLSHVLAKRQRAIGQQHPSRVARGQPWRR